MKAMSILSKYFNAKDEPGVKTLSEFAAEVRELSENDKIELATLAAKELGEELEQ